MIFFYKPSDDHVLAHSIPSLQGTFANRTIQPTTKVCKRAVFLPTHELKLYICFIENLNLKIEDVRTGF